MNTKQKIIEALEEKKGCGKLIRKPKGVITDRSIWICGRLGKLCSKCGGYID